MGDEEVWDAFGSDDERGDNDTLQHPEEQVGLFLAQSFLKKNAEIALSNRRVALFTNSDSSVWRETIESRGIKVVEDQVDAVVWIKQEGTASDWDQAAEILVPGGCLVVEAGQLRRKDTLNPLIWNTKEQEMVYRAESTNVVSVHKWGCPVQTSTCPWLPSNHSVQDELERVDSATVALSSQEILDKKLKKSTIQKAVRCMEKYGYCILPQLLDPQECLVWGQAVLDDLHETAQLLLARDQVDLYHPHNSKNEPESYRELSMREDLRMDLRSGPKLKQLRGPEGNRPWTVQAKTALDSQAPFLRGNHDILQIIRHVMNPVTDLCKGNFGRYNFDASSSGPDGSFQDLRVGTVGGIVSLPGAADQAIHADTPHLFEHLACLPAHYINVFAPGCSANPQVGQTAFVHASHRLDFTARYCGDEKDAMGNVELWKRLVRPFVTLGDCLLFDCRILHFGLANVSQDIERPILYTNTTMHWFHDPKNWDDQRPIFDTDQS